MRRSSTDEFVEKARLVHGNKYDYSKVDYINSKVKVTIICPKHGEFEQTPNVHLSGYECKKCSNKIQLVPTTKEFIEKARLVHGDKYDYSKVNYVKAKIKIIIICPKHGEFEQSPNNHLSGHGCPNCANKFRLSTTEEFIEKAKLIHGNKYDYSKTVYEHSMHYVTIICPNHGEFKQIAHNHLYGNGCKKCGIERARISKKNIFEFS